MPKNNAVHPNISKYSIYLLLALWTRKRGKFKLLLIRFTFQKKIRDESRLDARKEQNLGQKHFNIILYDENKANTEAYIVQVKVQNDKSQLKKQEERSTNLKKKGS